MKKILFILPIIFLCFILNTSAEGETVSQEVYNEVYYSDLSLDKHYSDLQDAIDNVKEGGKVYLKKDFKVYSSWNTVDINKSLEIVRDEVDNYKIEFINNPSAPVFNLSNNIDSFKMTNISATGMTSEVIDGDILNLDIVNSKFDNCTNLFMINNYSTKTINISIQNTHFTDTNMHFKDDKTISNLKLSNNTFKIDTYKNRTIDLKNINLDARDNSFENYSMIIDGDLENTSQVINNHFSGNGKILIKTDGEDINFNENKIFKTFDGAVSYEKATTTPIDFTQNWWGYTTGPKEGIIVGNVDTSNWAVFENFSRFRDDPYTINDIKETISLMGQVPNGTEWIFDMDENNIIDFLDLIEISRKIE